MTTEACYLVYVTAPNEECASALARQVVEERLAACANVLCGGLRSFYWWEGRVQDEAETALILKTRADCLSALSDRLVTLHPYETPCVVSWPLVPGHMPFFDWVLGETGGGTPDVVET